MAALVTLAIHCHRCDKPVSLHLDEAKAMHPTVVQRWHCPYCAKMNASRLHSLIVTVSAGHLAAKG